MKHSTYHHCAGLIAALFAIAGPVTATEMPSQEEMWNIIQQQQREIEALKAGQKDNAEKVEAAVEVAEESQKSAAGAASWTENTQIGAYGELHYNNLDSKKEIDFHRFVLFFGHQFTDRLRFWSELELEHTVSGDDRNGDVQLEQAYVEYDLTANQHVKGGIYLLPVGILNETHEPPTFYGVERNPVERNIIPTTWWAGGVALNGEIAPGWSYDIGVHEGLETSAGSNYAVRSGRQKTSEANANDLASTGRIKWTGMAGIELAATVQYQMLPRVKTPMPATPGCSKHTPISGAARSVFVLCMPCGILTATDLNLLVLTNKKVSILNLLIESHPNGVSSHVIISGTTRQVTEIPIRRKNRLTPV